MNEPPTLEEFIEILQERSGARHRINRKQPPRPFSTDSPQTSPLVAPTQGQIP